MAPNLRISPHGGPGAQGPEGPFPKFMEPCTWVAALLQPYLNWTYMRKPAATIRNRVLAWTTPPDPRNTPSCSQTIERVAPSLVSFGRISREAARGRAREAQSSPVSGVQGLDTGETPAANPAGVHPHPNLGHRMWVSYERPRAAPRMPPSRSSHESET